MIEPTERSMPPATMTIVMPTAAMLTIAVWRAISSRLAGAKNCGPTSAPKMMATSDEAEERSGAIDERPRRHAPAPPLVAAIISSCSVSVAGRDRLAEPPAPHDRDAVAQPEQLGQVAADHQHRLRRCAPGASATSSSISR